MDAVLARGFYSGAGCTGRFTMDEQPVHLELRSMRYIAIVLLGFLALMPAFAADPVDVGVVQLLGSPQKFDGKVIRVVGFLSLEFEGVGLYMHREDFQNWTRNGLWIDTPEKTDPKLARRYVQVVGTFAAKRGGHMGFFSAGIRNVTELIDLETLWKRLKLDDCAISSAELSPAEQKLVGSWEQKLSGERRIDTFEADRTHWVVFVGPLGEIFLYQSSRWGIHDGFLDLCDVHRASTEECRGPRRYGMAIDEIGPDKLSLIGGSFTFTRCERPAKPEKSDLVRCR